MDEVKVCKELISVVVDQVSCAPHGHGVRLVHFLSTVSPPLKSVLISFPDGKHTRKGWHSRPQRAYPWPGEAEPYPVQVNQTYPSLVSVLFFVLRSIVNGTGPLSGYPMVSWSIREAWAAWCPSSGVRLSSRFGKPSPRRSDSAPTVISTSNSSFPWTVLERFWTYRHCL